MTQNEAAAGTPALLLRGPGFLRRTAARIWRRPRLSLLIAAVAIIVAWAALLYLPLYLPRREFDVARSRQIAFGIPEARVEELLGGRANATSPPEELAWLTKTKRLGSPRFWIFDTGQSLQVVEVDFDASGLVTRMQVFFCRKRSPWQKLLNAYGL
jgi:hypothetical protein